VVVVVVVVAVVDASTVVVNVGCLLTWLVCCCCCCWCCCWLLLLLLLVLLLLLLFLLLRYFCFWFVLVDAADATASAAVDAGLPPSYCFPIIIAVSCLLPPYITAHHAHCPRQLHSSVLPVLLLISSPSPSTRHDSKARATCVMRSS